MMILRRRLMRLLGVLFAMFFLFCLVFAEEVSYRISYSPGGSLLVKKENQAKWAAVEGPVNAGVVLKGREEFEFLLDGKIAGKGIFKRDHLEVKWEKRPFFSSLNVAPEKIKLVTKEKEPPWEFKYKGQRVKVERGGKEYGEIKFYPENGKLKAKDKGEKEVAEIKGAKGLTAALAPFLISDLDAGERNLLILLLFALNR